MLIAAGGIEASRTIYDGIQTSEKARDVMRNARPHVTIPVAAFASLITTKNLMLHLANAGQNIKATLASGVPVAGPSPQNDVAAESTDGQNTNSTGDS